jgi:hypothetical protein
LTRRLADGARFATTTVRTGSEVELAGEPDLAFVISANGTMRAATEHSNLIARDGDTVVTLSS